MPVSLRCRGNTPRAGWHARAPQTGHGSGMGLEYWSSFLLTHYYPCPQLARKDWSHPAEGRQLPEGTITAPAVSGTQLSRQQAQGSGCSRTCMWGRAHMDVCVCENICVHAHTHVACMCVCVTVPMWAEGGAKVKMSDKGQQLWKIFFLAPLPASSHPTTSL